MRPPRFSDLARFRVHDILLVSSLYDSFILAEDGELHEVILKEFLDLNVRHTPGITHVSTAAEALALAWDKARYNLIIASTYLGDMSASALARRLRESGIDTPVVALAYDMRDDRSEEHTSELQSPYDLVCRLLLEKKKKKKI